MTRPLLIAPSILASDFSKLGEEIRAGAMPRQAELSLWDRFFTGR